MVKENSKKYKIVEKRISCLYNEVTDTRRLQKRNKKQDSVGENNRYKKKGRKL